MQLICKDTVSSDAGVEKVFGASIKQCPQIEVLKASTGVGYGEGCPFPNRLGGQGSVVSSPAGSGLSEGHKTPLFAPIWGFDSSNSFYVIFDGQAEVRGQYTILSETLMY